MSKDNSSFDRVGSKRYKRDFESDENSVPSTAKFNFFVKKRQNERLFDPDTVAQIEPSLSANVLNRRFSQRSKEREVRPLVPIRPSQQSVSRHQALSYSAVAYLQLIFNTILIVIFLYIILNIILVLRQDLLIKEKEHMDVLHQEKVICTNHYMINHCGDRVRVPAIEEMCNQWSACMQKDMVVTRAKVSAEAFGEILNSFVEPISYKALFFFTLLMVGSLLTSNMAFGLFHRKQRLLE